MRGVRTPPGPNICHYTGDQDVSQAAGPGECRLQPPCCQTKWQEVYCLGGGLVTPAAVFSPPRQLTQEIILKQPELMVRWWRCWWINTMSIYQMYLIHHKTITMIFQWETSIAFWYHLYVWMCVWLWYHIFAFHYCIFTVNQSVTSVSWCLCWVGGIIRSLC